ncbi:MAG: acetyl-CoA carboxylase biotin carboxyl carrier protein [Sphaerobacteraceae bacterium]|nr:MAG: acetyl-CoA carboxylase biotin carboxyl carrier protein [Sphaerobacteraceae bacterium]
MADDTSVQVDDASSEDTSEDYSDLTRAVRELVDVMHSGNLERLEVTRGDLHILLRAHSVTPAPATNDQPVVAAQPVPATVEPEPVDQPWHQITSPMVGTYYEAPSPGEPPYVQPGDTVAVGQTVAIIEAMKIMNEIIADRPGVIEAVLVENGEAVEFGHPLFRMKPA